jgi:hypothetical protein
MELTTAFESEKVVDGDVCAYTLTITKYWLDGRARRYGRAQGRVLSNLSKVPNVESRRPLRAVIQRRSIYHNDTILHRDKYVI